MTSRYNAAIVIASLALTGLGAADDLTLYVAPGGNDAWSGRRAEANDDRTDGPLATLHRARDRVRELKRDGRLTRPVTVLVRAGTYYLTEPLVLGPEDSGTADATITYAAYPGETAVLSGGRPVTGWRKADGPLYEAELPDTADRRAFRQLFVDGRRETRARYPNPVPGDPLAGWLYVPAIGFRRILSAFAYQGDELTYAFETPAAGEYHLWVSAATLIDQRDYVRLRIDGEVVPLGPIRPSGSWRKVVWSEVAAVHLEAGPHRMRWEHLIARRWPIHFDAFLFTTRRDLEPAEEDPPRSVAGEHRVVVQGEEQTGVSSRYGVDVFVTDERKTASRTAVPCPAGTVRPSWLSAPGAEVHIFSAWGWFNQIARIAGGGLDPAVLTIEGKECQGDIRPGNRFYVENVRAELDQPGEWYLDAATGRLTYWPRDRPPAESIVVAPRLTTLLLLQADVARRERVEYVTIRGFRLTETDYTIDQPALRASLDATVLLDGARHCAIEECTFGNVGGYAIRMHLDSTDNVVRDNEIREAGAGGIILTSASVSYGTVIDPRPAAQPYAPLRNIIRHNHIHHSGRIRKYVAGVQLDSRPDATRERDGNVVSHNLIHDLPRNGIFAFRNQGGNVIEHNHICHVMLESDDGAGIHLSTCNYDSAPNLVRHNVIHDVVGWKVGTDGTGGRERGHGIYLDNVTSSCRVQGNLVYRTSKGALMLNGGQNHRIENNIFAHDKRNLLCIYNCRGEMRGNVIRRNIFAWSEPAATLAEVAAWAVGDRTAELRAAAVDSPGSLATMDSNVLWHDGFPITIWPLQPSGQVDAIGPLAVWRQRGMDVHSVVADPRFVAPSQGDYRLRPDSPSVAVGFVPLRSEAPACPYDGR